MKEVDDRTEWLEVDGAGGFASGTASGIRTRRYHALLLTATTPPTGRMVLVNGVDVWVTTPSGRFALSTQRYGPDVLHPDGYDRISWFTPDPWPTWEFETPDGYRIRQEIVVEHGSGAAMVAWRLLEGAGHVTLEVRPFLSGRDYHSMHHENAAFQFVPETNGAMLVWTPYPGIPAVHAITNGAYTHSPEWYRNFLYMAERDRGLDDSEDLASPGVFVWTCDASANEAVLVFSASRGDSATHQDNALERAREIFAGERRRRSAFPTILHRAADAYVVRRGNGRSIVAGYPWFTDWGRDTFIAIRGLCMATGRLADARDILLEWSGAVSQGMLPNRFPDTGELAEFNAVDASLWFVVAVHDLLDASTESTVSARDRGRLQAAVKQIVEGYAAGTRYGIRADSDGLLAAGEPGVQLTWMDARVGDRVITPRVGKPAEVQALWLNALQIASAIDVRWQSVFATAQRSFRERFWNAERSCLYDVVDVDHIRGTCDPTVRPNQILAVGGLPFAALEGQRARLVVDAVERELLTPFGLRSLAPFEPGYSQRYEGGSSQRDAVYHQGTVWPWLLGPFIDAWVRVRRGTEAARRRAYHRFLVPLLEHVATRGYGHVCEITDAESPFTFRGCPFQAWSLGELLRVSTALSPAASSEGATADHARLA
jgi:predicted glycogen debranching enzyme